MPVTDQNNMPSLAPRRKIPPPPPLTRHSQIGHTAVSVLPARQEAVVAGAPVAAERVGALLAAGPDSLRALVTVMALVPTLRARWRLTGEGQMVRSGQIGRCSDTGDIS